MKIELGNELSNLMFYSRWRLNYRIMNDAIDRNACVNLNIQLQNELDFNSTFHWTSLFEEINDQAW